MTVKSIVDIDVNDASFKAFSALFDKYTQALAKAPGMWAATNKEVAAQRTGFESIAAAILAQNELSRKFAEEQKRGREEVEKSSRSWRDVAASTTRFAANIRDATASLLKWTAVTGIVSGLVGAGGIFGIDRLALGVSAGRRSSLGLGLGYGEQQAFAANFARLVDPGSFLSSVAGAKFDVTQRVGLIGAGLTPGEIGGDTGSTAVALLRNLKQIADTTNPALFGQVIAARRLGQFVGPQDLERLRNTPRSEFNDLLAQYRQNRSTFDLPPDVQRSWQEFTTQISRAGQGIENTFVRGLAPLAPGLTKLSAAVEQVVGAFLVKGGPLEKWITQLDASLEKFAGYVGTGEFATKVGNFVTGVGQMADAVGRFLSWFGVGGAGPTPHPSRNILQHNRWMAEARESDPNQQQYSSVGAYLAHIFGGPSTAVNNPGNLRVPGSATAFQQFPTPEGGVAAMARQLRLYQNRDHIDTLSGIISKYAPSSENDTAAYIADVSKRTGIAPGQRIDVNDVNTLSRVLAAMINHEQRKGNYDRYKDAKVVVTVLNNTGGSANVTVNGLKN